MNKHELKRSARKRRLAELLMQGLSAGREELALCNLFPCFRDTARFTRGSALHAFVNRQPLTSPHPGTGGHRKRVIKLDSRAEAFVRRELDMPAPNDVPDFTPQGDPIFSAATQQG